MVAVQTRHPPPPPHLPHAHTHALHHIHVVLWSSMPTSGVAFEDVLLVEFVYLVLTHMPGTQVRVSVGDSGLC